MLMSQKFADYFDGVLSCAPGFNIPRAILAQVSDFQVFAQAARSAGVYDRYGQPFVNKVFTDEELAMVSTSVLEPAIRWTARRTAASRISRSATPQPFDRTWRPSPARERSGRRAFPSRRLQHSNWPWDAGIGGRTRNGYSLGWRAWKLGDYDAESVSGITTGLVALSSAAMASPPIPVRTHGSGPSEYLLAFDLSRGEQMLNATDGVTSAMSIQEMIHVGSTDLTAFRNRGGKLLIAHGVSDPIFSINDSIRWWNALDAANGGNASDFARVFAVPGMQHCAGGPATDQFDAFSALVNWVEKGPAPDQIIATAGAASPWPGRTRPLCAYPKIARYKGTGSLEEAASFECR
jgi:feruloyl esterase